MSRESQRVNSSAAIQAQWDRALIEAWEREFKTYQLILLFLERVAPILNRLPDWDRRQKYIESLNLARCPFPSADAGWWPNDTPIRGIINGTAPELSNALWSESISNAAILNNIHKYRVRKFRRSRRARNLLQRARMKYQTTRRASARAGDLRHDWKTTK